MAVSFVYRLIKFAKARRMLFLVAPGSSWFKLHWERPARDFDASRAYVEQILDEALRGEKQVRTALYGRLEPPASPRR
ncbi:MAG: hypothetical protein ACE5LU_03025 [Anaerolineae bacterium]